MPELSGETVPGSPRNPGPKASRHADRLPYDKGSRHVFSCLVTHSGVTLAPVLGRLVATEIATDQEHSLLQAFRPTRFTGARGSDTEVDQHATRLGEQ